MGAFGHNYSRPSPFHRLCAIDRGEIIFEGGPKAALASEEIMKTLRG